MFSVVFARTQLSYPFRVGNERAKFFTDGDTEGSPLTTSEVINATLVVCTFHARGMYHHKRNNIGRGISALGRGGYTMAYTKLNQVYAGYYRTHTHPQSTTDSLVSSRGVRSPCRERIPTRTGTVQ